MPPISTLSPGDDVYRVLDILFIAAGKPDFDTPCAFSLFVSIHICKLISHSEDDVAIIISTSVQGVTGSTDERRYKTRSEWKPV